MNQEEAVHCAIEWLRHSPEGDRTIGSSAVKVMGERAVRTKDGWHIPFDSVVYLDGIDFAKKLIPTPVVFVPDDGGEITYAMDVMARGSGIDTSNEKFTYWAQVVDPEFDRRTFPYIDVPTQAILRWEEINEREERTGEVRPNPEYTVGPIWRGWPESKSPAQKLRNYYRAEWIDHNTFAQNLLDCEVLVPVGEDGNPLEWPHGPETARNYQIFSSSEQITAGNTKWSRQFLRVLLWQWFSEEPKTSFILDPGRILQEQFSWKDPNLNPGVPAEGELPASVEEVAAEASAQAEQLFTRLTKEFSIEFPKLLKNHVRKVAEQIRDNGYELTSQECARYTEGYARYFQNIRGIRNNRPQSWPKDLAEHGLIAYYDNRGQQSPTPWTFGKFDPQWTAGSALDWHRVVGAYVGFAIGEAQASTPRPAKLGVLTKKLLSYTDTLLRTLPPSTAEPIEQFPASMGANWVSTVIGELDNTPEPLVVALAATLAGAAHPEEAGTAHSQKTARNLLGEQSEQTLRAVDILVSLFRKTLQSKEFAYPVHIYLQQIAEEPSGLTGLVHSILALRDDRETAASEQIDQISAESDVDTSLGRALFAAAKLHFDPEQAVLTAAASSGNTPLISALTGALMGARFGIPGLPATWVHDLPQLGAVENIASDAFRYFTEQEMGQDQSALRDWAERYPRDSTAS